MAKKKGKVQQGRAKQKQKAQKGNNAGPATTRYPKQNRQIRDYDDEDDETFQSFRGFSQSQPASTSVPRAIGINLRHQSIAFVSAGVNPSSIDRPPKATEELAQQHTEDKEEQEFFVEITSDDEEIGEDIDDSGIQTNIMVDNDIHLSEHGMARMNISGSIEQPSLYSENHLKAVEKTSIIDNNKTPSETPAFVIDTVGDPALKGQFKLVSGSRSQRTPSPTPSNSSEEVILFHGRNQAAYRPRTIEDPVVQTPSTLHNSHVTDDLLEALQSKPRVSTPTAAQSARQNYATGNHPRPGEWTPAPAEPFWRREKGKAPVGPKMSLSVKEATLQQPKISENAQSAVSRGLDQDKDAEETIATLQAGWKDVLRAKEVSRSGETKSKPSKRRGKRGRKKGNRELVNAIFSDDDDLDGEAAYDDYMQNIAAQLDAEDSDVIANPALATSAHSIALSGPSMVVDGKAYGDDELLSKQLKDTVLANTGVDDEWESDSDSELNPESGELSSDESLNASDLEEQLEYTEQQQWEDEADLRQRRVDAMSDEHLARLFAKQQELGFDGDELIIDDGEDMLSDGVGDVDAARAGIEALGRLTINARNKKVAAGRRSRRSEDVSFPDASAFADALDQYGENGFDIMDYDRPSLRPTKKGRKGRIPPEIDLLSDEELKEDLNDAWENDRRKKRQKKLEREELRAQGLLGPGGRRDYADLAVKYSQGMTLRQVYNELREFLLDDDVRERSFPPMDKKDRKALHEISMVLQVTCKSQGAGKNRFPVLYKKRQTIAYSDDLWQQLMEASSRGFFTNRGRPSRAVRGILQDTRRSGRGLDKSGVTLRNGEIVGAGAKELGRENFGHRLMEKMGWTKGQALGKDGGGLLVPVEQRMRVGTAGLG